MLGKALWRESTELDKLDVEGEGDVRDDTQSFCKIVGAPLSWGQVSADLAEQGQIVDVSWLVDSGTWARGRAE